MKYHLYFIAFLLLYVTHSKAQLCNGTLGAPIFTETFGAGTGSGQALPAGVTTYNYTNSWPSDGQYTIANTANPAPGNAHWYNGPDHTGNTNGYMLVVNASYTAGEFYSYKVSGLCPNTFYVFSAWIANVNKQTTINFCNSNGSPYVYANVLFKVTNTITSKIDSVSTGNIPPGNTGIEWKQFGFGFSTGANQTSVILSMVNNSNGGCGNDLIIDDITFSPCGPTTAVATVPAKAVYCPGDSLLLDATIGPGYSNAVYQWQYSSNNGLTWQDISGANAQDLNLTPVTSNTAGMYRLILAENGNISLDKCRIITDTIFIKTAAAPNLSLIAAPDTICAGQSSLLTATGAGTYVWNTGTNGSNIQVSPTTTTSYQVTGTDLASGCSKKENITVNVIPLPASPVVALPDSICTGNNAILNAIAPGGNYIWYTVYTGGTPIYSGNPFTSPPLNTSITYYVETVSGGLCTSATRTAVQVYVIPIPAPPLVAQPDTICSGAQAKLNVIATAGTYNWYTVVTGGTPVYTGNSFTSPPLSNSTTYYVEATAGANCMPSTRTAVKVNVLEVQSLFSANPLSGVAPLQVNFTNQSIGANSYHWYLEKQVESYLKNPSHIYSTDGHGGIFEVMLIASSHLGCADTSKLTIVVDPYFQLIIPNIFTPNNDGVNDVFKVESIGAFSVYTELFNRWGTKLFEWNGPNGSWDGTYSGEAVTAGTYFYLIKARGLNAKEYTFKGHFMLMR